MFEIPVIGWILKNIIFNKYVMIPVLVIGLLFGDYRIGYHHGYQQAFTQEEAKIAAYITKRDANEKVAKDAADLQRHTTEMALENKQHDIDANNQRLLNEKDSAINSLLAAHVRLRDNHPTSDYSIRPGSKANGNSSAVLGPTTSTAGLLSQQTSDDLLRFAGDAEAVNIFAHSCKLDDEYLRSQLLEREKGDFYVVSPSTGGVPLPLTKP